MSGWHDYKGLHNVFGKAMRNQTRLTVVHFKLPEFHPQAGIHLRDYNIGLTFGALPVLSRTFSNSLIILPAVAPLSTNNRQIIILYIPSRLYRSPFPTPRGSVVTSKYASPRWARYIRECP